MARKETTKLNPPPDAAFPLSSMIDVVFLLLIFFIVTQKPIQKAPCTAEYCAVRELRCFIKITSFSAKQRNYITEV